MMAPSRAAALSLSLFLGACHYDAVRVHTYWGTTVDRPAAGSVYEWSADSGHLDPGQDERIAQAVQEIVDLEMARMGWIRQGGQGPVDYLVSIHTGRGLQPSPAGPEQRANLAFTLTSAADGRIVYRACADALIEPTLTPEERRHRLERAIANIIRPLAHPTRRCSSSCGCHT